MSMSDALKKLKAHDFGPVVAKPTPVSATEPEAKPVAWRVTHTYKSGRTHIEFVHVESLVQYYREDLTVTDITPLYEAPAELATLRARLAEAERVTEEQVERACVAVAAANQTPWPTGDVAFDQRIRRRMHTALTAARGGG